ncbi:MAG: Ldh family oxidoreductase [Chloroflexi bacterium]|nr:Ldh family oxidoreductase [Chloroflexota bacterium]
MEIEKKRVAVIKLNDLCLQVFDKLGIPVAEARIITEVLLAADLRGVDSHGIARLGFYANGLRTGVMKPHVDPVVVSETTVTALIDAGGGMGHPVSYRAMQMAIAKAVQHGLGLVTVRNSNHFGIAGYYAMMALESGCIGMTMTNSAIFVVPTFARNAMLGTNPIAVAAPAGKERPYVLDMATSIIPFGKVETYDRLGKPLPLGWATDETGRSTQDAARVIKNAERGKKPEGGLLPVGGEGELMGGHKGYGLGLLVDVLCGVLPGALYSDQVYPHDEAGHALPSGIGHIFGAIRVDAFRPLAEFKASMDDLQQRLKNAPRAEGAHLHPRREGVRGSRET